MSFSFSRPMVSGEVNQTSLSTLEQLPSGIETVDAACILQLPLYEDIARLAGVQPATHLGKIGRSRLLQPGCSQLGYPNSGWHTENNEGYMVADACPTEFLLAEADVVQNFWHRHCGEPGSQLDLWRLSFQANRMCDESLKDEGFEIWSPEPLEVVAFGPTDMHRSAKNTSETPTRRNFAMLFRSLET